MNLAAIASRQDVPLDDLFERSLRREERRAREGWSRRAFLGTAAAAGAGWLAGCQRMESPPPAAAPTPAGAPRIAIVGAGVAGLNAAHTLKKAGLNATLYEASDRAGGRMFTARGLMGPELTTELGGEFIDSDHEDIFVLMKEFGLERMDMEEDPLTAQTFFFNGRHYTMPQTVRAFLPLAKQIAADRETIDEDNGPDYTNEAGGKKFDVMSIAQYLDRIGAKGWMRELLDVAYLTEYGLECGEQSALNLILLIDEDLTDKSLELFGESDERYKVKGGNDLIVQELAKRLTGQIQTEHALEALRARPAGGYTLSLRRAGGTSIDADAEVVLLTLPFSKLREAKIDVELPPQKRQAIQELGYGTSSKVFVGFKSRPWRTLGYAGQVFADETFQLAWDNSQLQPGAAGALTLYGGGRLGIEAGNGTAEEAARRLLPGVGRVFPGALDQLSGKFSRFHWPTHPWTRGGYSCYKPGQWTSFGGAEIEPVGNLYFAGEHCSGDYQGYMNGGAQTGREAAEALIAAVSKRTARAYFEWARAV
jgi:monoamine oxidase